MTYFLELCKHLLTDLTQLDMTRYTISIPLWKVRKKEILRKVLKMASTTGFPGMIDAHTFSLDWQVLVPSSTFRGKKMNSPCCRATSTVRLLLLLMAARQQNWLLLRWTERYFALWSEILHLFLWRFSASSCRCPIAQDLVVVLSSHSVRSHQLDGSLHYQASQLLLVS